MKLSQLARVSAVTSALAIASGVYAPQLLAQDSGINQVVKAGQQINQSASKSQAKIDKISAQIQSKLQQFKAVNKEIDGLEVYNGQMQTQIDNQFEELANIATSMEQVSVIERQISPLMARMIDTLATFVALDVPFLEQERSKRIDGLKTLLERADVAVSEKFRRVLEAYQVEVDYGRTIEAYTGLLEVDSQERDVDFLRIGRVTFVYQTRDGNTMGIWNQTTKAWQELPNSYRSDINKALRIARKQLAPDLIVVPLNQAKTTAAE